MSDSDFWIFLLIISRSPFTWLIIPTILAMTAIYYSSNDKGMMAGLIILIIFYNITLLIAYIIRKLRWLSVLLCFVLGSVIFILSAYVITKYYNSSANNTTTTTTSNTLN